MKQVTTHRIHKSNQLCFLLPWQADRSICPYPHTHMRVGIPHKTPVNGTLCDVRIVRLDNLRKQVDNTTLPKGQWIHLT